MRQIDELRLHFEATLRLEAAIALSRALDEAEARITRQPDAGLTAPRPYPDLARAGRMWLKAGRYWIAYAPTDPAVILGIFYDTADIPGRV